MSLQEHAFLWWILRLAVRRTSLMDFIGEGTLQFGGETASNFSINILGKKYFANAFMFLGTENLCPFLSCSVTSLMEPEQNAKISLVSLRLILPAKFYLWHSVFWHFITSCALTQWNDMAQSDGFSSVENLDSVLCPRCNHFIFILVWEAGELQQWH